MEILADLHNHTEASGHAYSSVEEIAREAKKKGLKYIGITDHGPELPGEPDLSHIENIKELPLNIHGVQILKGVEANIVDQEGNLDVPESYIENLDIVLAGLHNISDESWNREGNTRALLNTMENEDVDIITHPGNPDFPIDRESFVLGAKESETLVEINNSSFVKSRAGSSKYCKEIALLCKKYGVPVIINSDSHISRDVGETDQALKLLKSIDMPKDLIVNSSLEAFESYFKKKNMKRIIKSSSRDYARALYSFAG